jgi:hypothetical protein
LGRVEERLMPMLEAEIHKRIRDLEADNERLHRLLCSLIWLPKVRAAIEELPEDDRLRVFAETL